MMILFSILVFIIILGLLIFVHELGHFVAAKRAGMKVEEFGFGFPPRLFGIRRGETMYSINWIPLGGFVKILGEDGGSNDPRAFGNGKFSHRLVVLVAGVAMNFIFGWFLLFLGFAVIGIPLEVGSGAETGNARLTSEKITIVAVQPGSPAEYAGFKHGDTILAVDGKHFDKIEDMIVYTKTREGQTVTYQLERGKQVLERDVTPRVNPPAGTGAVGFQPAKISIATYPILDALKYSWMSFVNRVWLIFSAFGMLIAKLFSSGEVVGGLSGPVGIAVLTQDFARLGLVYLTQFAAVLSINLGVINAFPFPALDGGRILFLIIEKIRGAKSLKLEQSANTLGFVLLLLLMVVITFHDVGKFSEQFKRLFERML